MRTAYSIGHVLRVTFYASRFAFHPRRSIVRRAVGRILKKALALRYRHFTPDSQLTRWRRMHGGRLLIARGVFDPTLHFTSRFFARHLSRPGVVRPGSRVLDMGTGSGVLAIAAAWAGAGEVVAVDLNSAAVRSARHNVRRFSLGKQVTVLEGDLFAPVQGRQFDLIVCNPPYFKGEPRTAAARAYYAGHGYEWLDRFTEGAAAHLSPAGRVLLVLGDAADLRTVLQHLSRPGWTIRLVARKDIWVEVLYIFEMRRLSPGV